MAFDAEQKNFDLGRVAAALNRQELVLLYVRAREMEAVADGLSWLSDEERRRYHGYRVPRAATQFLHGRTLLRRVLSNHLGIAANEIDLSSHEHVKPIARCRTSSRRPPQFNLSHSGEWITIALHSDLPVGIDIECATAPEIEILYDLPGLLTSRERSHLKLSKSPSQKANLFLRLWRCKEAIMKATGKGFALAPNSIEVLTPDGAARTTIHAAGRAWQLRHCKLRLGLSCAVAVAERKRDADPLLPFLT